MTSTSVQIWGYGNQDNDWSRAGNETPFIVKSTELLDASVTRSLDEIDCELDLVSLSASRLAISAPKTACMPKSWFPAPFQRGETFVVDLPQDFVPRYDSSRKKYVPFEGLIWILRQSKKIALSVIETPEEMEFRPLKPK